MNTTTAMTNGWDAQTKILPDLTYYTETPGIWQDRVTKRDRLCQVTDGDLARQYGASDMRGNRLPQTRVDAARLMVELVIRKLPHGDSITPRAKWDAVEAIAAGFDIPLTLASL